MRNKTKDVYDTLPPELKLMLLCIRQQITEKDQEAIDTLLAEDIDWNMFVHLAVHHRIYPLVYQHLRNLKHAALPSQTVSILRQMNLENISTSLQMTGELLKVLRSMEENGIRFIVLKGFPLGYKLYGNVAVRPSRDMDILVWPEDMDKAPKVIELLGYNRIHPSCTLKSKRLKNWMKTEYHFEFWHKDKESCLELHWKVGHQGLEMPLTEIENSLEQVKIAGQHISILASEELLLFLVIHGASHVWFRLRWLCDIGMIVRRGGFSWERLYRIASHLGFEILLNQAVILSRKLLGAPVPDNIFEAAMRDPKAKNLADMVIPFITNIDYEPDNLKINMPLYYHYKKYGFSIRSGWRKKFAYLYSHFSPEEKDMALISLPECLNFVYYLIRPCTWFSRRVSELAVKQPSNARWVFFPTIKNHR